MRLESVRDLKRQLLDKVVDPFAAEANRVGPVKAHASAAAVAVGGMMGDEGTFGIGARPFDSMPQMHRSLAIGVSPHRGEYRLAIRLQRSGLRNSPLVERLTREARGEVDVRHVGRIDKRAKKTAAPWRASGGSSRTRTESCRDGRQTDREAAVRADRTGHRGGYHPRRARVCRQGQPERTDRA
jgi:hypothetical protein